VQAQIAAAIEITHGETPLRGHLNEDAERLLPRLSAILE